VLHEQIRITRPGGTVSAVACFCQTDGLPHYHGRYPLPGNQRLDDLSYKLWQVFRRAVRPRLLGRAPTPINQELLWEFKTAGLTDVQINGHLTLVSPGDARLPLPEAIEYSLGRHEVAWETVTTRWQNYSDELIEAGFSQSEFDELTGLMAARGAYLQADPSRVREVMEVYTDAFLMVKGTRPCHDTSQEVISA